MSELNVISQVAIAVFGLAALFMVAKKNRWGFVLGLTQQPFWFFTTIYNEQWGLFVLSIAYTISWLFGVYEWFWKKKSS